MTPAAAGSAAGAAAGWAADIDDLITARDAGASLRGPPRLSAEVRCGWRSCVTRRTGGRCCSPVQQDSDRRASAGVQRLRAGVIGPSSPGSPTMRGGDPASLAGPADAGAD